MADTFLFDDFFVGDTDPGQPMPVTVRGKQMTLTVKRALTLGDVAEARAAAMKTHISDAGSLVIDGIDTTALTVEMLSRLIVAWPFVMADGTPVPVTKANIMRLQNDVADAFEPILKPLTTSAEEALAPFVPASDEG